MQPNDKQRRILVGVLRDRQRLASTPVSLPDDVSRRAVGSARLKARMARDGLVPVNLGGWVGHLPTSSETVMYCREYLRLTQAGERVAQALMTEEDLPDDHDVGHRVGAARPDDARAVPGGQQRSASSPFQKMWTLAIFEARNPPEWAESGEFRATRPPRGNLHEIERAYLQGFLALENG